jgi:hypothetical protein
LRSLSAQVAEIVSKVIEIAAKKILKLAISPLKYDPELREVL